MKTKKQLLKFGKGNAKLDENPVKIHTFSIPAGHACPFALKCLSKAIEIEGKWKIRDGKMTEFRCFAASQEALYSQTRDARWHNFDLLKSCKSEKQIVQLILDSLPENAVVVRVHVSGDFFNQRYFNAWMEVARQRPDILFYAYTKSLPFWANKQNDVPKNFVLTASEGGRKDNLIELKSLRSARVVFSKAEARKARLKIDKDDSLAMKPGDSFALLLHGSQPKGTKASEAWQKIRKAGGGYSKNKKKAS